MSKNICSLIKVSGFETLKWLNHFISFRVKLFEFDIVILFQSNKDIELQISSYVQNNLKKENFGFSLLATTKSELGRALSSILDRIRLFLAMQGKATIVRG